MNGTAATVAVGAGAQQQQSSPTNRGNPVAAVSPTRRLELPASDAGQSSSSSLTKEMCSSRCAGTSDSSTVNTADMSCADTDTGFGPANADHDTASASRCVLSDTALTTTSQEASTAIDNIDSRASTPTPTPSLHSTGGIGGDDHDHDDSPSISSSSSRSGSHHSTASETPSEAASDAASEAAIDATSHLQFDTAMIEQIAARAAAAAAAAVFGVVQQEEDTDALAEEVASMGSSGSGSGSFGGAAEDETNTNNAAAASSSNNSSMRAYSVQSLEQYNRSGSCTSVGSRNVQQDSITSPSITFPLPIFGSGGKSGKKRRLSASSGASAAAAGAVSAATGAIGTHNEEAMLRKMAAASKKKALFYPTKKKRKVHPSASASTSTVPSAGTTAKPRAIVVQKQPGSAPARATTSVHRNAKPPKGRIEIRTVPPTIKGIHEAARVLLSSTTANPMAYPMSPTSASASASTGTSCSIDTTEGILSFPTETVYTLTTCITVKPLLRSSSTSSTSSTSASEDDPDGSVSGMNGRYSSSPAFFSSVHSPSLTRLLRLKGRLQTNSKFAAGGNAHSHTEDDVHSSKQQLPPVALCADVDPALLYIHTPTQCREFVHFTKPKTFVLKPSSDSSLDTKKGSAKAGKSPCLSSGSGRLSPKSAQQSPAQVPAVTFSESREVLDRLTNVFWPGPVIIYAKCKMRKTLRERHLPSIHEESSLSPLKMPAKIERQSSEEDEVVYAPILPTSILHPYMNTGSDDVDLSDAQYDKNESFYYVGMRCPSHPLARRALEEVYSRNRQRQQHQAAAGSSSGGGRRVRSRVVVGFNAKSATWTDCPISAKEVSSQLNGDTINLCPHETEGTTSFIDVLNGEDEREMFMAPTCQFGKGACISLVVDDDTKTIHIVHPKSGGKGEETNTNNKSKITPRDIVRALRTSPRASIEIGNSYEDVAADAAKVASRVISVVLNRWKCAEHK